MGAHNETFAKHRLSKLIGSFSTPGPLGKGLYGAKRSCKFRVLNAFRALGFDGRHLRKINKFAPQAPFFKGFVTYL